MAIEWRSEDGPELVLGKGERVRARITQRAAVTEEHLQALSRALYDVEAQFAGNGIRARRALRLVKAAVRKAKR